MPPKEKVLCEVPGCCGKWVSDRTARSHRLGKAPILLRASVAEARASELPPHYNAARRVYPPAPQATAPEASEPSSPPPGLTFHTQGAVEDEDWMDVDASNLADRAAEDVDGREAASGGEIDVEHALLNAQERTWAGPRFRVTVEDASDDDDDDDVPAHPLPRTRTGSVYDPFRDEQPDLAESDEDTDDEFEAISVWDELGEALIRAGIVSEKDLTEHDLQCLRAFSLKVTDNMPGRTFAKLPYAFPGSNLGTWKTIQAHVAKLSGFEPQVYHCCVNSCCCFVGPHAELTACPYCHTSRLNGKGRPRQVFVYLPIIPRLKAMLSNAEVADLLQHRARDHKPRAGIIHDVFDSKHYLDLCSQPVEIDGKKLRHQYFEDERDIALGLSTDGFAPFKRRTKTAWPLIAIIYNLPPEIRSKLEYVLGLGVIPGPRKPHDFDSFLWPFLQEMLRLAVGVHAYDVLTDDFFALHAFLILVFGDIPAISMLMNMKGHNGLHPCRMCKIRGIRIPDSRNPIHYVPLDRSRHPDVRASATAIKSYNASALPLRTHSQFMSDARKVQFAATGADAERFAKESGVKGVPILSALHSLSFPESFPYDFMHLMFENVVKNMMNIWCGNFKDLDTGTEDYEIESAIWSLIGAASEETGAYIPHVFGPRPPNVASDKLSWTSDTRSFWMQYVGPVLLKGRFKHEKYYKHFHLLVCLVRKCLKWDISSADIAEIRTGFIRWVNEYEVLYYQKEPKRLSACPLTVHALLHIADSIVATGPVWTAWAFPMERYCGRLQPAIRSRRHPYASLNRYVLDKARLDQIKLKYGSQIRSILTLRPPPVSNYSTSVPGYPALELLPASRTIVLDRGETTLLIGALCTRFSTLGATPADVRPALPPVVTEWAKLRILNDGDTIRASTMQGEAEDGRDASFVRYELQVDQHARRRRLQPVYQAGTFYGQLQRIIHFKLGPIPSRNISSQTLVFAVIQSCVIEESDEPLDIHYFSRLGAHDYVDAATVACVVGRVKDRGRFALIDRSGDLVRATFTDDDPDTI